MGKGDKDTELTGPFKKYKRRMKRLCRCGAVWVPLGLVIVIIGIVLVAYFTKYWGNEEAWERHLAYAGVAFIIIGLVALAIGIGLLVILCVLYRKMSGSDKKPGQGFHPPSYAPGSAPYPQQPVDTPSKGGPEGGPMLPPQNPSAPAANPNDVGVEVSDHHKF